ncbi:hypothetical protein V2A60_006085 [Cordyceps javanica]
MAELIAGDSSSTTVLTQTGFGEGTQVTMCTAQFTLPVLAANETEGSDGGSATASATNTPSKAGAPPRLMGHTAALSISVALVLAGILY